MNLLACEAALTVTAEGFAQCSSGFTTVAVDLSSLLGPITINTLFEIPSVADLQTALSIPFIFLMIIHLVARSFDHLITFMTTHNK